MDRRAFLSNCVVAGAAASVFSPSTEAAAVAPPPGSTPGSMSPGALTAPAAIVAPQPRRDWFTSVRGQRLEARFSDGRTVGLTVADVEDGPCCARVEAFVVVLRAETGVRLPGDGSLVLAHPAHGEVPVWAQPASSDPTDGLFHATFALLR